MSTWLWLGIGALAAAAIAVALRAGAARRRGEPFGFRWFLERPAAHDPERAEVLREALAQFAKPPSRDRAIRGRQLAALRARPRAPRADGHDSPFAAVSRRYWSDRVSIEVVLVRHALAHADELRGR